MPPAKKKAATSGRQAKLDFGGGKLGIKKASKTDPSSEDDFNGETDTDVPAEITLNGKKQRPSPETSHLPPIASLPDMFADIVKRTPELEKVAAHLGGRPLRVATMCSGTESPLLALGLVSRAMGNTMTVEHVFSCEIEPFKQAYIERNFSPPLLFRDVCELGRNEATTAYGALAPVPGDVDLLVAGTSCVDFSNLNNARLGINAGGESSNTFHGMLSWVKRHRPPIVILENVCSAPWPEIVSKLQSVDYAAQPARFDTKQYYIPHTRTRGYCVAIDTRVTNRSGDEIAKNWLARVKDMARPASVPLDAFLLEGDDPRIWTARAKLVQDAGGADRRAGKTDWGRCESRHQKERFTKDLGTKRPMTGWDESGFCQVPDYSWIDWWKTQVERVWDLSDILYLTFAQKGIDPLAKSLVWNLSQNVDRQDLSMRLGISPCLTPSMIPFLTARGGPMTGLEALSLQGLPIDELLLTRETEDQLMDLAGNAMSTTVVGTAIISALVGAYKLIKKGDGEVKMEDADDEKETIENKITGIEELTERPLDLTSTATAEDESLSVPALRELAARTVRLCVCEGRTGVTSAIIKRCLDCGATACARCAGRPEHNYVDVIFGDGPEDKDELKELEGRVVHEPARIQPREFERALKRVLPMCVKIDGIKGALKALGESEDDEMAENSDEEEDSKPKKVSKDGSDASKRNIVRRALELVKDVELRFVMLKRQEIWVASYEAPAARLELHIYPHGPEWRLYGVPAASVASGALERTVLAQPLARCVVDWDAKDLLGASGWQVAIPETQNLEVKIKGMGEKVPSWEARLGLQGKYRDKVVWSTLKVEGKNVSGEYKLLERCGTAAGALHVRETDVKSEGEPPLYLFFDPSRGGSFESDGFVIAKTTRRLEYGETRLVEMRLSARWRPKDVDAETVKCVVGEKWADAPLKIKPASSGGATVHASSKPIEFTLEADSCAHAHALLVCKVPLGPNPDPIWPHNKWTEVDKVHERGTYRAVTWLTERVRDVDHLSEWRALDTVDGADHQNCERCAPTPPAIIWFKHNKRYYAIEDKQQAGPYEQALKNRPSPFVTQLRYDEDSEIGTFQIGVNIATLAHRALANLPTKGRTNPVQLSYRLTTNFVPPVKLSLPAFLLKSNRHDPQNSQPKQFKTTLRPEQLRSLHWMLGQEQNPPTFVEEEIAEALLEPLGWRAEGKAERKVDVRGGVLADEVGYGKTAITLALIASTLEKPRPVFKNDVVDGGIKTNATLTVVPPHLVLQWPSEVEKFAPKALKTIIIKDQKDLNGLTIQDIIDADIVIAASGLFKSDKHLENLTAFAGVRDLPNADGRHFNVNLEEALERVKEQVRRLQKDGSKAVWNEMVKAIEKADEEMNLVLKKRLKGKQYREKAEGVRSASPTPPPSSPISSAAPPSSAPSSPVPAPAKLKPAGKMVMEVVIPLKASSSKTAIKAEVTDDSKKARRTVSRNPIMVPDSDSEDEAPVGKSKGAAKGKAKAKVNKGKRKATSEDEDFEAPDEAWSESDAGSDGAPSESEDEDEVVEHSEEEKPKPKGKTKAPAKPKAKPKAAAKRPPLKKRKTEDDSKDDSDSPDHVKKQIKEKKSRVQLDPWDLKSDKVRKDWKQMKSPPLEAFNFKRVVVDEYTYLDGKAHSLITHLQAQFRWVLSGTPPIHDFAAVKTIAVFLGIHLGINDDSIGSSQLVKKRRKEETAAESFHSFRDVRSLEWHTRRHQVAQNFLNQFVRQNVAEIDEIKSEEQIVSVKLPAAERAIYLELKHHLQALDMNVKKTKKTDGDREKRLAAALGDSQSAEEALLKRCSHFDLDVDDVDNAVLECEAIVQERDRQLDACKSELAETLPEMQEQHSLVLREQDENTTPFGEWIKVTREKGVGDADATKILLELMEQAGCSTSKTKVSSTQTTSSSKKAKEKKVKTSGKSVPKPETIADRAWKLREDTHVLRKLVKELVARVRSHRFFVAVRDLQQDRAHEKVVDCASCGRENLPWEDIALLSSCGHIGCEKCVREAASLGSEVCVLAYKRGADVGGCAAGARDHNVVKASSLGKDEPRDRDGKHFGKKLEEIMDLIKTKVPKKERVLIFVQFPDLMKKVAAALNTSGMKFLQIQGTANAKSKALDSFQKEDSKDRVLLLNVMDESASGANLTTANHAIFLSPLLTPSAHIYDACETQAIGRVRRYGQTKLVHVWRFLTVDSIDTEIYEDRVVRRRQQLAAQRK